MTKHKTNSLAERLNIGDEVRELKLGATFNQKNTTTAYHTIKYDFKPASVDKNRIATVDVGSNNQVTVTVPNLLSSGVPHTVYKGNHRKYTKECVIIYDKETGDITIEKLNHNIQVKKTREMPNKQSVPPPAVVALNSGNSGIGVCAAPMPLNGPQAKLENSTMRISSKTKVSTGSRRNNIIDFKPRNSPMQQSSPSRTSSLHRSPQSAPVWNANNAQQTLPSIPMIFDDDDAVGRNSGNATFQLQHANGQSSTSNQHNSSIQELQYPTTSKQSKQLHSKGSQKRNSNQSNIVGEISGDSSNHSQQSRQEIERQQLLQWKLQYQLQSTPQDQNPPNQRSVRVGSGNDSYNSNNRFYANDNSMYGTQRNSPSHTQSYSRAQISEMSNTHNSMEGLESPHDIASQSFANAAAALEQQIAVLSASSSSSESDSSESDSGTDSDDSTEDNRTPHSQQQNQQPQPIHQLPNLGIGGSMSPHDFLQNDLQLSNTSDDDEE